MKKARRQFLKHAGVGGEQAVQLVGAPGGDAALLAMAETIAGF